MYSCLAAGVGITLFVANRPDLYYPSLYQFFIPQTHVGSLCVVLYGLALALLCVRRVYESGAVPKPLLLIYAALCALGGMSNLLFMVQMLAPLTASLGLAIVFTILPMRTSFVPIGLGWSAAAIGAILNRVLFDTTSLSKQSAINYESVMVSLDIFARGYVAKSVCPRPPAHPCCNLGARRSLLRIAHTSRRHEGERTSLSFSRNE